MFGKDSQLTFIMILLVVIGLSCGVYLLYTKGINLNKINMGILQEPPEPTYPGKLTLKSPAFDNNGEIPIVYSCKGANYNPPMQIFNAPNGTQSFVLVVDDPDAPVKTFDHWIVFNINPKTTTIPENSVPTGGILGQNGLGKGGYQGPCPPTGKHRYNFKLYALDILLESKAGATKEELAKQMAGHILDKSVLVGTFGN